MFISKSNVLKGRAPSIISGVSADVPSNMTNSDFSLNYTSSSSRLVLNFGAVGNINYVAVCASNYSGGSNARIVARNGTTTPTYNSVKGEYTPEREHITMFNFDSDNVNELIIVIDTDGGGLPTVHYVAAGNAIFVPNGGETSGYGRQWLTRGVESRNQGNDVAAPVANLTRRVSLSGSLNLPNMRTAWARSEWQEFLDFASANPFFICEQQVIAPFSTEQTYRNAGGLPEASYICFNPKFSAPSAHSDTRALQNVQLRFDCYNGL